MDRPAVGWRSFYAEELILNRLQRSVDLKRIMVGRDRIDYSPVPVEDMRPEEAYRRFKREPVCLAKSTWGSGN